MEPVFEDYVQGMVRLHNDTVATVKILRSENQQLSQKLGEVEARLAAAKEEVNQANKTGERPSKLVKGYSSSLHATTAAQRIIKTASPRPPYLGGDDDDGANAYSDSEASESSEEDSDDFNYRKARFTLIAHSGDEREKISPRSREITLPVLVKSYVEFKWNQHPKRVLVMVRPGDDTSLRAFNDIAQYLWSRDIEVLVESGSEGFLPSSRPANHRLDHATFDRLHERFIDFIVTLGGDGTFIRAAYAFPNACPPILAFAFGSLGFLTPFPALNLRDTLDASLHTGFALRLRARLEVTVLRADHSEEIFQVLNECVVDRGTTSSLVRLNLYSSREGRDPVTTVQGDGLIIATPTGSTAYSLSAGGSMVHPSVPAILVTPICPHSLSFRPILIPDSATLRVQVAPEARNSAWLSLDGRKSIELKRGDQFVTRFSSFPVPAAMARRVGEDKESDGWLASLRTALSWNVIQAQKPLNIPMSTRSTTPTSLGALVGGEANKAAGPYGDA